MSLTEKMIKNQINAMKSNCFDIGIRSEDRGFMINRKMVILADIIRCIRWLKHMNAQKNHIYIRPTGPHSLSLLDDINLSTVQKMKKEGYAPSVVIETSPGNYQAWLNHGRILKKDQGTYISKILCDLFDADSNSVDYHHYGRLAGFTNPKNKYLNDLGFYPYARLIESTGVIYERSDFTLEKIIAIQEQEYSFQNRKAQLPAQCYHQKHKTLSDFHKDPRYCGDLHRADLAWATHAAFHGISIEEVKRTLLNGRDLSHKGCHQRQLAYVNRTAVKAFSSWEKTASSRTPSHCVGGEKFSGSMR